MSFVDYFRNFGFPNFFRKRGIGILIIVALLAIWGLLRACSHQELLRKRTYIIGRDSTWYPMQLMGKDRNLQAFSNDLMTAIAQETKLRFQWVETGPGSLLEGLNDGYFDAVISSLRPNFIHRDKYVFSDIIFELGPVLVVRQDSPVTSLKDMQGKTVGIRSGSYLIFNNVKESGAHAYNILITTYDNVNKALESLDRNQIDGIIVEAVPAYAYIEGFYAGRLKIVTAPLTDEGLRLVGLRDPASDELISDFDDALRKLIDDGTYDQLINKWNLINPETRFKTKN